MTFCFSPRRILRVLGKCVQDISQYLIEHAFSVQGELLGTMPCLTKTKGALECFRYTALLEPPQAAKPRYHLNLHESAQLKGMMEVPLWI